MRNPYIQRNARRESFEAVPETCPDLEKIMANATESIRSLTVSLREALDTAIEERMTAEDRADSAESRVSELEKEVDQLTAALRQAEETTP